MIMNKTPLKSREEGVSIALEELKSMFPAFLLCNGSVLLISGIFGLIGFAHEHIDWRILTGLVVGNAAIALNIYHLGVKAAAIVRRKNATSARRYASFNFFVRYIGAFIVFGILIHFGIVNIITCLVPLFIPKIHYTLMAVFNKSV